MILVVTVGLAGLRLEAATWREFESPHFDLYTDAMPPRAEEFLGSLEQFRSAIARRLRLQLPDEDRVRVIMFTIADDFALFVPKVYAPVNVRGMALASPVDPLFFGMLPYLKTEPDRERRVFFHEFTHLLYGEAYARAPLWFSEGIAELFSTFRVDGDRGAFGAIIPEHLLHLRYQPRLPLPRLFALESETRDFVETSSSGVFYPEAWAFVHFCTYGADPALMSGLMSLVNRQRTGEAPSEQTIAAAFGMPLAELERRFDAYLQADAYRESTVTLPSARTERVAQRELADEERQALLGALAIRTHGPPNASQQLQSLIAKWPAAFAPHVELALAAIRHGDRQLARTEFCRAAALQPRNARFATAAARSILENASAAGGRDALLTASDVDELRRITTRARANWPESDWTLELTAETESRAPEVDERAVRFLEAASTRRNPGPSAMFALARLHHRQRKDDEARQWLDRLLANRDTAAALRRDAQALRADLSASKPPSD